MSALNQDEMTITTEMARLCQSAVSLHVVLLCSLRLAFENRKNGGKSL